MTTTSAQPEFDPLFIDLYEDDDSGDTNLPKFLKDLDTYCRAGSYWNGVFLKASEGTYYTGGNWFQQSWQQIIKSAGSTLGSTFFRGAYHYLRTDEDPTQQADLFLGVVKQAGGFLAKDIWPVVDVESAENGDPSSQQIIDHTSTFAERVTAVTGKQILLYGNSLLHDASVTSQMNCSYLWVARYTATLPAEVYTGIGWPLSKLWGWQFRGDDDNAQLKNQNGVLYPNSAPGIGECDITVLTFPGGLSGMEAAL